MNAPYPGQYPPNQPYPAAPQPYPQPYPPAPGGYAPPQQQAGPVPAEGIAVTTQYFPLGFMLALFKPKVFIDGYETPPVGWGRSVAPVRPGQHQVHVHVPYFLPSRLGPADAVVDVYPGRFTELEYRAPLWSFSPGSLGAGPQKYNGVGITIAVAVLPMVFFLLMMVVMLAAAA